MHSLIKMDLYRMRKTRFFRISLGLALLFGLCQTPFLKLVDVLGTMLDENAVSAFAARIGLSSVIRDPFPLFNAMLAMLSACAFFYGDHEGGYIRNIAGQMPRRGCTVLSKYLASIPHNLAFMAAGMAGNLAGTLLFRRIVMDGAIPDAVRVCLLRFLLLQGLCAILVLVTGSLRARSLGTVLSVLFGIGALSLFYGAIDSALHQVPLLKNISVSPYMPDQLLESADPDTVKSIISSAACIGIFLPLAVHTFNRRDIK